MSSEASEDRGVERLKNETASGCAQNRCIFLRHNATNDCCGYHGLASKTEFQSVIGIVSSKESGRVLDSFGACQ